VAYSADARRIYTVSVDQTVREWKPVSPTFGARLSYRDHGDQTWVSLLLPDRRALATGGSDGTLQIRPIDMAHRPTFTPTGLVAQVAFSPDGTRMAFAGNNQTITIWDRQRGFLQRTISGHAQPIWSVAYSSDGKILASGGGKWNEKNEAGDIKLWDAASGKERATLQGHTSLVTGLAFAGDTLVSCGWDGRVIFWDVATGKAKLTRGAHKDVVRHLTMSRDGKLVATASFDGTVRLWDPQTGNDFSTLTHPGAVIHSVSFSPDGKTLAAAWNPRGNDAQPLWSGKGPGEVVLWDVETRKEKGRLKGMQGKLLSVAFSPDGVHLATGGGKGENAPPDVKLWDVKSGRMLKQLSGARQFVGHLTFTSDGKTLAGSGGMKPFPDGVALWDIATELARQTMKGHTANISCAELSRDGKLLATGSFDRTLRVWDTTTWQLKAVLTGHEGNVRSVAFSPDGQTLVSGSEDKTARLWDVATGKELAVLARHETGVKAVAFTSDGRYIATGSSEDGRPTGQTKLWDAKTRKEVRSEAAWANRASLTLAFSPDGRTLATGSPGGNSLQVFDVATGRLVRRVATNSVRHLAWSPDGQTLATGHGTGDPRGVGSIHLWNTQTWAEKAVLQGHTAVCLSVAFARDGRTLTSASADGTAKVWDLTTMGDEVVRRR
jgi:WD40 repeat protein